MQQIESLVLPPPSCTDAEVAEFGALVSSVPTLKNDVELSWLSAGLVARQPFKFDHPAAQRRRRLLILSREIVLAQRSPKMFEHGQRFSFWMQGFSGLSASSPCAIWGSNGVLLILFCTRRKANVIPFFLL